VLNLLNEASGQEPRLLFTHGPTLFLVVISARLHTNISLLYQNKSASSLSYLGSKLAPVCMVLAGSSASICMALALSTALKAPDVRGMARLSSAEGTQRLSSLNSIVVTIEVANSMLSCS
jgi:hypothetical protein